MYFVFAAAAALVEELFLRGVLMPIHEKGVGTSACLLFAGLTFALLQGDPLRAIGAFAAGCAFAYIAYIFDSVWPAVIAHLAGGLYLSVTMWMTDVYAPFGIGNYFFACNLLGLLLFLYLTVRTAQGMLVRDSVPHFAKSAGLYDLWLLMRNPGFSYSLSHLRQKSFWI
ncbi:MAG: type II CAAX prenyl endopeptidase Rce1 family protein [Butyricicoccaceae bacterium]